MTTIAVVGLGYVGLPLAVEFGKKFRTIGFDLSAEKIACYKKHYDPTGEVSTEDLKAATLLEVGTDASALREADFVVVAVPTPVDDARQPDFSPLVGSSTSVGRNLKQGAIVVFESTVYPGATEEICIPIIEKESGKVWKKDFFVGYSPERINPGDKERTVTKIVKVVSGDTPETLAKVQEIYGSVITAGVYPASCIKVAEAAKVIENTQRDVNIALINELALIFRHLEKLEAEGLENYVIPLAIRLQFEFAARRSEICPLEWDWIDLENRRVVWPDSKTGGISKPMSEEAYRLLSTAPRLEGCPYVLPSPNDPAKHLTFGEHYGGWCRTLKAASVPHVGTHGIRHRSTTDIANSGVPTKVGMKLTGHKTVAMFMHYVHTEDKPVREAAELVASRRQAITGARQLAEAVA